jgi:predicted nucleic acid-binding protein
LAILDADDENHVWARDQWQALIDGGADLVSGDYVLIEAYALIQSRLGSAAVRAFTDDVLPVVAVAWADEMDFRSGVSGLLAAARRKLSLVDCVSFAVMRRRGIEHVFCFDRHFAEQGFRVVPEQPGR